MFRILCFLIVAGLGYLAYDNYGYRYYIGNVVNDADQSMTMGAIDPNINIVAYVDYDSAASRRLYPKMLNLLASDSNIRLIIRPIETDTKLSKLMTRVALAAKSQGHFMSVNNIFLTSNNDMDEKYVEGIIRSFGLNYNRLKFDATSPEIEAEIKGLQAESALLNIDTFPYFFIEHVKMIGGSYSNVEIQGIIKDLRSGRR